MISSISGYFNRLAEDFGRGWNRFWFTPADPLPLAVIRLGAGAVTLYWYLTLAPDLARLFAPGGWLPMDVVRQVEGNSAVYQWSYFNYFQGSNELWTVYILGGLVLAAFFVGWQTRVTAPLALVTVLSTIHRAPLISSQLEPLLTMVLLYLALGPVGACLSVDAWRKSRAGSNTTPHEEPRAPSLGAGVVARLLQVHLALLYACMGLSKLFAESWWSGSAVWWLITRSESRLADFTWLYGHPFVVNFWTHSIVVFEIGFAILIWNRLARPLLLAVAVVMWCSITLLTGQLAFLAMMLIANLAFVPACAFDACCAGVARRTETSPAPLSN
jgi:hypothetical protein